MCARMEGNCYAAIHVRQPITHIVSIHRLRPFQMASGTAQDVMYDNDLLYRLFELVGGED